MFGLNFCTFLANLTDLTDTWYKKSEFLHIGDTSTGVKKQYDILKVWKTLAFVAIVHDSTQFVILLQPRKSGFTVPYELDV